jgi:ribonucleoside-triphosphate reductase (formate)
LDSEKYGKVSLQTQNTTSYTQGMTLNGKTILSDGTAVQECISIDKLVNGGLATSVDITDLAQSEVIRVLEAATELPFFRPRIILGICTTCGHKSKAISERCEACKSPHKLQVYS